MLSVEGDEKETRNNQKANTLPVQKRGRTKAVKKKVTLPQLGDRKRGRERGKACRRYPAQLPPCEDPVVVLLYERLG